MFFDFARWQLAAVAAGRLPEELPHFRQFVDCTTGESGRVRMTAAEQLQRARDWHRGRPDLWPDPEPFVSELPPAGDG